MCPNIGLKSFLLDKLRRLEIYFAETSNILKKILPPTGKKVAYLFKNEEPEIESTKFDQLN